MACKQYESAGVFFTRPLLEIDLNKIKSNATVVAKECARHGVEMVGVVKACLGNVAVAEAMIAGGAAIIGDSRLSNLKKLRGLKVPLMMLRQPMLSEIEEAVLAADYFLVSEIEAVRQLACASKGQGRKAKIILMVELGDLREGILPEHIDVFAETAAGFDGVELVGLGANVACLQGIPPTSQMLDVLLDKARMVRERLGIDLPVVSGGNSSAWKLLANGLLPAGITQLRFGEGILLGQETIDMDRIEGTALDAFVLSAEIIEIKDKPDCSNRQKGNSPINPHTSTGRVRKRAILALGSQDISVGSLQPLDPHIEILRRSSDHLIADISGSDKTCTIGDYLEFIPSYEALLAAMTSPFVEKRFR